MTTPSPSSKSASLPLDPATGVALVVGLFVAFTPGLFNDGDTFLHVAAGARMLDLGHVLTTDPFSYTFGGKPWQTHEWLAEVVMALTFRAGGWAGVALLFGVAVGSAIALLVRHVQKLAPGPVGLAIAALPFACLAPSLLARPHILALPLMEPFVAELVFARRDGRGPRAVLLAVMMWVWCNMHGSFVIGLVLAAAFGLEDVIRKRDDLIAAARPWAILGALLLAAVVIGPHGIDNLTFPLKLTRFSSLNAIGEWAPMNIAENGVFALTLAAGLFALLWRGRRLDALPLLVTLALIDMSFSHVRHVVLFAVIAPLMVAEAFATGSEPAPRPAPFAAMAASLAVVAFVRMLAPLSEPKSPCAPVAGLAHVPASLQAQPVFNAYAFGAYLAYRGVKPYVDSRAEVYGDDFLKAFSGLEENPALLMKELEARHVAWTLEAPGSQVARALDASPGWTRLYADPTAVVHVRAATSAK